MATPVSLHDDTAKVRTRWLNGWRGRATPAIVAGCAGGVALIVQCWLVARIIAAAVIDHQALWPLIWALPVVLILRAGLDTLRDGLAFSAGAAVRRRLRARLMERMVALGPSWMERQRSGAVAATVADGVDAVQAYFASYLPQRIIGAFVPLAILFAVFPADRVSGIILLVTAPIIPVFMIVVGKGAEAMNQTQWRRLALLGAHVFDAIQGLTVLRQFGASAREAEVVARLSDDYRRGTMQVLRLAFLSSLVLEFFATIAVAMVAVYVGFRLYYGQLDFLPGLFALLLAPEFYRPLRDMGQHYHARMEAIAAAEGLIEVLDTPVPEAAVRAPLPAGPLVLRAEGARFTHAEGGGAGPVDLELRPAETVALVGPSGAGKTTLARMLLGLLPPQEGRITVNGADLAGIDPQAWHARIGWLPQRATLFAGTLRDNIALAHPDASARDIVRAAADACADRFIDTLPLGYDTPVGDGGQGLSGGQVQRIAMARALIGMPEILILDEPTAALDRKTADDMLATIRMARPHLSILLITHDAAAAARADRILTLEPAA